MLKQLTQKKFFIKREAKIFETKVVYKSSLFGRSNEFSINSKIYLEVKRHIFSIEPIFIFP